MNATFTHRYYFKSKEETNILNHDILLIIGNFRTKHFNKWKNVCENFDSIRKELLEQYKDELESKILNIYKNSHSPFEYESVALVDLLEKVVRRHNIVEGANYDNLQFHLIYDVNTIEYRKVEIISNKIHYTNSQNEIISFDIEEYSKLRINEK